MLKILKSRFILSAFLTVFVSFAYAEDNTSSTLEAVVLSQAGVPVSGASVNVRSTGTGVSRSATSGSDGSVRFPLLAIGSYDVVVNASGLSSLSDTISLSVGDQSFRFVLASASASNIEDVVVTAGAIQGMDFNNTTTGISVKLDDLMSTTPVSRNLTSIVLLAPGTAQGDSAFGNLASISGSSVAENVYLINGLNTTNFRNFTGSSTVPFEFYDTVEVKTGGYSAEFGKAIGGVVNAVTKSGTNEFKFGANLSLYPDSFYEDKPDTYGSKNSLDERDLKDYNVYVGGPIIKDKAFFYLLANPKDNSQTDVSQGGNKYVYESDEVFYGAKLDYYVTDALHLEYTYFTDENTGTENTYVDNALNATTFYKSGGDNEIFKASYVVSDDLTIAATWGTNAYNRTTSGTGDAYSYVWWPYPTTTLGIAGSLQVSSGYDEREVFKLDADYYVGNHHIRFGIENEDLLSVAATKYSGTNAPDGHGGLYYRGYDNNGNGSIDSGERLRLRVYDSGGAFATIQEAIYIQDSWQVSDQLNVNIGLRREMYDNQNASGQSFIKVEDQDALRLGATYDLYGDGDTKLYMSYGEYYLPIAGNTNIRSAGAEFFTEQYCAWDGAFTGGDESIPGVLAGSCEALTTYSDGTVPDTRELQDLNIEPMYGEEVLFGYSTTLNSGWTQNIYYVERELASTIEDVLIDHALAANDIDYHQYVLTNPGNDMNIYTCLETGSLSAANDACYKDDAKFGYLTLSAEDLAFPKPIREYTAFNFEWEKPWDGDWSAKIAYTKSNSEGNYEGTVKSDNGQDDAGLTTDFDYPEFMEGSYGKLPNHREHNLKFFGAKSLANNLVGGLNASLVSPRYYGCIGNHPSAEARARIYDDNSWYCGGEATPRGTISQSSWIFNIDAMLSYKPQVSMGDLTIRIDVFNILNADSVSDIREFGEQGGQVGNADPNYLKPTNYQSPRRIRLGAQWRF